MKKRACAWILALGLVFCQMPQTAWAAEAGEAAPGTEITEVTDENGDGRIDLADHGGDAERRNRGGDR